MAQIIEGSKGWVFKYFGKIATWQNLTTNAILFVVGIWAIPFGATINTMAAVGLFFLCRSSVCFLVLCASNFKNKTKIKVRENLKKAYVFTILVATVSFLTVSLGYLFFEESFILQNLAFTLGRLCIFPVAVGAIDD